MVHFLIMTAATPSGVAGALHDAYAADCTSDVVPRRDTGALVTVTRCEFTWHSLLVSLRAVPSVGGTNVHVNIRSPWFISLANALAFAALVVFGSPAVVVVAIVLGASITLVVRRITRLMKAVSVILSREDGEGSRTTPGDPSLRSG